MKKVLKVLLWTLLALLVAALVFAWIQFGPLVKGALSVKELDEGLYYMEFKGDDGFDSLMEEGGGRNSVDLAAYTMKFLSKGFYRLPAAQPDSVRYGCSSLVARTPEGSVLMGRNFDFPFGTGIILHNRPKHGYESITTFNSDFYGFGEGWKPEGFVNQYLALTGLFFALDGVNEKGLAVADLMAGDNAETHQETGKPALTTTSALKYLLNRAATVDEAVELLRGIDMHSDIGSAHHYAIADASGRSVVVEYVDNEIVVVETPACANHYLCDAKLNVGLYEGDDRYDYLCTQYEEADGLMDKTSLATAIAAVSSPEDSHGSQGTVWTTLMDLTHPSIIYWSRCHFDKPFQFEIGDISQ